MSAVVYGVGYDTSMIKTRKNMVTMQLLAAIKENQFRKTETKYQDFEAHYHI